MTNLAGGASQPPKYRLIIIRTDRAFLLVSKPVTASIGLKVDIGLGMAKRSGEGPS
jgi:hypothetical protein